MSGECDARWTEEIVNQINSILQLKAGALTKWNKIASILFEHNLAYKQRINLDEIFVHPKNRSGLGVNPHNAHQTLAVVKATGGDLEANRKTTCFEMAPHGATQQGQMQFNMDLITRSEGLLAPPTGRERYFSVASSHFSQACRAVRAGCRTKQKALQDSSNMLNVLHVCEGDDALRHLITEGWEWTVIPWYAEKLWPGTLADLAQNAMNCEHSTFSKATEIQIMCSLSLYCDAGMDKDAAVAEVKASQPECVQYLDVIYKYVKDCAGGEGAPICRHLGAFAKQYGENKKLGHTFLDSILNLSFKTETTKFPFLRPSLIAANLVAPQEKVKDGIAKLLTKNGLLALTKKRSC